MARSPRLSLHPKPPLVSRFRARDSGPTIQGRSPRGPSNTHPRTGDLDERSARGPGARWPRVGAVLVLAEPAVAQPYGVWRFWGRFRAFAEESVQRKNKYLSYFSI